jgi:transcription elongation factor GreA
MSDRKPITPAGLQHLKDQLKRLREVEEPAIIREVATAREHGDLSENAEYHAAREHHSKIKGDMERLEGAIGAAEVIDPLMLSGDKVAFGASVTLSNVDTGEEVRYRIVGHFEADTAAGSISIESPIARALIGREVGDEVKVQAPGGTRTFEILTLEFR